MKQLRRVSKIFLAAIKSIFISADKRKKEEWECELTPYEGTTAAMQEALDWWHSLPVQNLIDTRDSWVGYLWKYYPYRDHPYHLTGEEVQSIYEREFGQRH